MREKYGLRLTHDKFTIIDGVEYLENYLKRKYDVIKKYVIKHNKIYKLENSDTGHGIVISRACKEYLTIIKNIPIVEQE